MEILRMAALPTTGRYPPIIVCSKLWFTFVDKCKFSKANIGVHWNSHIYRSCTENMNFFFFFLICSLHIPCMLPMDTKGFSHCSSPVLWKMQCCTCYPFHQNKKKKEKSHSWECWGKEEAIFFFSSCSQFLFGLVHLIATNIFRILKYCLNTRRFQLSACRGARHIYRHCLSSLHNWFWQSTMPLTSGKASGSWNGVSPCATIQYFPVKGDPFVWTISKLPSHKDHIN